MASSAGFRLVAGRIPGERIATTAETATSSGFTGTETVIRSVTAPLVAGRTYRVRAFDKFASTNAGDTAFVRLKEDGIGGELRHSSRFEIPTSGGLGHAFVVEFEHVAASTESKTFVLTGERRSGSGTLTAAAHATSPSYLYVDYIRG